MPEIRVCKKGEIADGGTRLVKSGPVEIGVIFSKGAYYAYRNVCPHFSIPLNYEPDAFWTYEGGLLMCAHHSAMFRFEDGMCVDGPCLGASLRRIPIRIENGRVMIEGADIT